MRHGRRSLWLAILLLASAAGAAELRQVESVGVAAIVPDARGEPPRDAALRAALARGVEGVAQSMLPSGWDEALPETRLRPSEANDLDPRLAPVLGRDPFEYATRFRILEDRGVRAALFTRDPEVESEYVVVVEVYVDAGRVRERLQAAGWLEAPAERPDGNGIRVILQDLTSFGAYDAVRRTLLDEIGVESALPVELTRGRAVLLVVGRYDPQGLQQALVRRAELGLRVVPLSLEDRTLTLLVDYAPPPAALAPDEPLTAPGSGPTH